MKSRSWFVLCAVFSIILLIGMTLFAPPAITVFAQGKGQPPTPGRQRPAPVILGPPAGVEPPGQTQLL